MAEDLASTNGLVLMLLVLVKTDSLWEINPKEANAYLVRQVANNVWDGTNAFAASQTM